MCYHVLIIAANLPVFVHFFITHYFTFLPISSEKQIYGAWWIFHRRAQSFLFPLLTYIMLLWNLLPAPLRINTSKFFKLWVHRLLSFAFNWRLHHLNIRQTVTKSNERLKEKNIIYKYYDIIFNIISRMSTS